MAFVLAVEEDPAAARVLAGLELLGHHVIVTADVTSALEYAAAEKPDLLLFDWSMLDMGAAEAMREVEARGLRDGVRVVLLSSHVTDAEIVTAYQIGYDAVLHEPESATALDETLSEILLASPDGLARRKEDELRQARLLATLEEGDQEED